MKTFRFVIRIALWLISTNIVVGQTGSETNEEDKTLIAAVRFSGSCFAKNTRLIPPASSNDSKI